MVISLAYVCSVVSIVAMAEVLLHSVLALANAEAHLFQLGEAVPKMGFSLGAINLIQSQIQSLSPTLTIRPAAQRPKNGITLLTIAVFLQRTVISLAAV
ncbi:hypothetical protein JS86_25570 [Vibrio vulnificus]|nr:hypothetical protein JS86_25570 [Vibrio vulnificus]